MTLQVFPSDLPGLEWNVKKAPINSTRILTARSGLEYRSPNWSFPKYRWTLSYSVLRQDRGGLTELQELLGFCLDRQGMYEDFLYSDPTDYSVTGQLLGSGTGSKTDFPLSRTMGTWVDPNLVANTVSKVYVNGVEQVSGWSVVQTGRFGLDTIRFASAPSYGQAVSADFTWYFPVRFMQDDPEFSNIFLGLWENKKIQFQSVK